MKVAQSCPTLCDPIDYTVHGILQARILEWVAFPFSRGSSQPRDQTQVSHTASDSLPAEPHKGSSGPCKTTEPMNPPYVPTRVSLLAWLGPELVSSTLGAGYSQSRKHPEEAGATCLRARKEQNYTWATSSNFFTI